LLSLYYVFKDFCLHCMKYRWKRYASYN
jgi:hypothetical protein